MPTPPAQSVIISAAPMFHIAGLNCQLVAATVMGQTIVYAPPGKWQEATHLELSQRHGATTWALVPTQLWRILDFPDLDGYDTSSVRNVGGGSAVWPPELLRTLQERIPTAARRHRARATAAPRPSASAPRCARAPSSRTPRASACRRPRCRCRCATPRPTRSSPRARSARSACAAARCSSATGATRRPRHAALDADRWYRTGDVGVIRDGYVHLEGRRNDLIIRGGENISPVEIENRLFEHPEIAEVAIVGVDHPKLGQEVAAFVVPHTPGALTEADVQDWVAATLAGVQGAEHGRVPRRAPAQRERQGAQAPAPVAGEGERLRRGDVAESVRDARRRYPTPTLEEWARVRRGDGRRARRGPRRARARRRPRRRGDRASRATARCSPAGTTSAS